MPQAQYFKGVVALIRSFMCQRRDYIKIADKMQDSVRILYQCYIITRFSKGDRRIFVTLLLTENKRFDPSV